MIVNPPWPQHHDLFPTRLRQKLIALERALSRPEPHLAVILPRDRMGGKRLPDVLVCRNFHGDLQEVGMGSRSELGVAQMPKNDVVRFVEENSGEELRIF